jgi:hypothetical protein
MPIKSCCVVPLLINLLMPILSWGQDSTAVGRDTAAGVRDTAAGSARDTLKPRVLKTATVTRLAPMIQHQLDRIVLNVDHQLTAAGTNALELLRQLPGVQVSPEGLITLNGHPGVNVLIDGKSTYLSAEDLASLLNGMPSSEVQKVEIMTNPGAKFDAEGTGGIINIVRKRNHADGLNANITATLGEGNYPRYTGSALVSYKTPSLNLYVNESYNYTKTLFGRDVTADILDGNNLVTKQVSTSREVTGNRANNTAAGIDVYLSEKTTLNATGNLGVRRYDDLTTSILHVFNGQLNKTGNTTFTGANTDAPVNYTTGLQLNHRVDTVGGEWSANADYSEFHYRPGQFNTTTGYDSAGDFESQSDVFLDQRRTLRIVGARADYVHPWVGNGKFEAGWKSSYVRTVNNSSYYNVTGEQRSIDSSQSDYNVNTEMIHAVYVNVNRQYKKLSLQAGLRAEQTLMKGQQLYTSQLAVRQDYFQLFPTLYAEYKAGAHNGFNLQLGRRIDRADYHELVPFRRPLTPTLFFQGNPYLRPSVTWHGEATWSWRNALSVTVGYDIDKDYVRTLPYLDANDSTTTRIPTNIHGAHSWDVNFGYNHPLTTWWTTNTSVFLYQNSFAGNVNGFSLDNAGIVSLDFTTNNSFSLSRDLTGEIDFETETRRQLVQSTFGAYSVLGFGLRWQWPGGKAVMSLNAHNVLQSEGNSVADHYLDLNQYSYAHIFTRAVTLTFNYRFGRGKPVQTKTRSGSAGEQERAGN